MHVVKMPARSQGRDAQSSGDSTARLQAVPEAPQISDSAASLTEANPDTGRGVSAAEESVKGAADAGGTRDSITELVAQQGPITASRIADHLGVTSAAVRRHLDGLQADGVIAALDPHQASAAKRGRPAKRYVLAEASHDQLTTVYDDVALSACAFIADELGPQALDKFAAAYVAQNEAQLQAVVDAAGPELEDKVQALANTLSQAGHAASVRKVTVGPARDGDAPQTGMQLCQGHCPMHEVSRRVPQLCQAESDMFARLLDVPVRRLATLAAGDRVCTTHIGSASPGAGPSPAGSPSPRNREEGQ